jgi:hypothetical protein
MLADTRCALLSTSPAPSYIERMPASRVEAFSDGVFTVAFQFRKPTFEVHGYGALEGPCHASIRPPMT